MDWLSNFGMREWLVIGGVVLVLTVLFDGFRRMRADRKSNIKMSLSMGGGFPDDPEQYGSELPNGGSRVIDRRDPIFSEQGADDLLSDARARSGYATAADETVDEAVADYRSSAQVSSNLGASQSNELYSNSNPASFTQEDVSFADQHQILVMHVKSKAEDGFNGSDLLQVLLACDMRYGERDILHRHEKADGKGSLQFSVANMIEPGTFSLEDINSFRTPGVTFFMTLPCADEPLQAFECMIETANCLVKNLQAVLLDEDHSTATLQVINQYRERIKAHQNQFEPV